MTRQLSESSESGREVTSLPTKQYMRPRQSFVPRLPSKKRGSYLLCRCEKETAENYKYKIGLCVEMAVI